MKTKVTTYSITFFFVFIIITNVFTYFNTNILPLNNKQSLIFADAPRFVTKTKTIPIYLIIKKHQKENIFLEKVEVSAREDFTKIIKTINFNYEIKNKLWIYNYFYNIKTKADSIKFKITFFLKINNQPKVITGNNLPYSFPETLQTNIYKSFPLKLKNWSNGIIAISNTSLFNFELYSKNIIDVSNLMGFDFIVTNRNSKHIKNILQIKVENLKENKNLIKIKKVVYKKNKLNFSQKNFFTIGINSLFECLPFYSNLLNENNYSYGDLFNSKLNGIALGNECVNNSVFLNWKINLLNRRKLFLFYSYLTLSNLNYSFNTSEQNLNEKYFGNVWISTYIKGKINPKKIIYALQNGNFQITNGPLIAAKLINEKKKTANYGSILIGKNFKLNVKIFSNYELGKISALKVILGDTNLKKEKIIFSVNNKSYNYSNSTNISAVNDGYVRLEVYCGTNKKHFSITNPIFLRR